MTSYQTTLLQGIAADQVRVALLENTVLRVEVSPETGGRVTRLFHKPLGLEFLWRNPAQTLRCVPPGQPYDPNFYGGIDEVIPGDMPETITGLHNPDHGELWTLPLEAQAEGESLMMRGRLPIWGLRYQKRVSLRPGEPWVDLDYRIQNDTGKRRVFLWKLHAAAGISPGDRIDCPAQSAVVADPAWSRWKTGAPFPWPAVECQRADIIPPRDGTTDFLFLYGLREGRISLLRPSLGGELTFTFDPLVFPYVCYFASFGGFDGHYTAVLEPCTAMPLSVNEAARLGQCSVLEAGEELTTRVSIYAGGNRLKTDSRRS